MAVWPVTQSCCQYIVYFTFFWCDQQQNCFALQQCHHRSASSAWFGCNAILLCYCVSWMQRPWLAEVEKRNSEQTFSLSEGCVRPVSQSFSPPQSAFYTCYFIRHSGKARAEQIDKTEKKKAEWQKGESRCSIVWNVWLGNGGIRIDCMEREGWRCERSGSCMRGLLVRNEQQETFIRLLLSCPHSGL